MAPPSIAPTPRPSRAALKLGVLDESPAPPPDPSGRGSRALIIAVVAITLGAVIAIVVLM